MNQQTEHLAEQTAAAMLKRIRGLRPRQFQEHELSTTEAVMVVTMSFLIAQLRQLEKTLDDLLPQAGRGA